MPRKLPVKMTLKNLRKEFDASSKKCSVQIVGNALWQSPARYLALHLPDRNYFLPTLEVADLIVAASVYRGKRYEEDIHDCDNFSQYLAWFAKRVGSNACGEVTSYRAGHAFSCFAYHEGNKVFIKFYEPQTAREITDFTQKNYQLPKTMPTMQQPRGLVYMR